MKTEIPKLEFEKGKAYEIEIMFDKPKTGQSENPQGKKYNWYLYGVKHNDINKNFFADYGLHDELKKYAVGDVLKVVDEDDSDNIYKHNWNVSSISSNKPLDEIMKSSQNDTKIDIMVWAGMKIAVNFVDGDITRLESLTNTVLTLHKDMCDKIKNNDSAIQDKIEELF